VKYKKHGNKMRKIIQKREQKHWRQKTKIQNENENHKNKNGIIKMSWK
jgi:hypothetical protein